jgi:prepilin-type N-terminal cleavage/methylation domain-containing protein
VRGDARDVWSHDGFTTSRHIGLNKAQFMLRIQRTAFTLIELLVVIAIIGILVALIIPAVQAAREAARRATCKNHLRQIGLALHSHHDVRKMLPTGWLGFDTAGNPHPEGQRAWGWASRILPYLEEDALFNTIQFNRPITDPLNRPGRETVLAIYRCPADPAPANVFSLQREAGGQAIVDLSRSNYVGVYGTRELESFPSDGDGVFFHNSRIRFKNIVDGLSKTFVVGERSSHLGGSTWVGVVPEGEEAMARIVGSADLPPNPASLDSGHLDDFSSSHATGAHFLYADGGVVLISDEIDAVAYRAMCTRAGRETMRIED